MLTLREGTWIHSWGGVTAAPAEVETMIKAEAVDGAIYILVTPKLEIIVKFMAPDETVVRQVVCRSIDLIDRTFTLGFSWGGPDPITVFAHGQIIGVENNDVIGYGLPFVWRAQPARLAGNPFEQQNMAARSARLRLVPNPSHTFASLRREMLQVEDLVTLVEGGRLHHLAGLSAHLRLLVARGGRNMQPLLQACAGHLDLALLGRTIPAPTMDASMVRDVEVELLMRAFDEPEGYEVDLDVFLSLRGGYVKGAEQTQNQMLRAIADKLGAHVDFDLPDMVPFLEAVTTSAGAMYTRYLLDWAGEAVRLSQAVLAAAEGQLL